MCFWWCILIKIKTQNDFFMKHLLRYLPYFRKPNIDMLVQNTEMFHVIIVFTYLFCYSALQHHSIAFWKYFIIPSYVCEMAYVVMGMVLTLIYLLQNMKYYKVAKMANTHEPPTKHTLYSYASIVKHIWDTKQFLLSTYIQSFEDTVLQIILDSTVKAERMTPQNLFMSDSHCLEWQ